MASFEDLQATLDEMMYGDAPASWEEIKAFLEKSTGVVMAAAQEEEIRQNYQREVEVLEIERQNKENADIEMFRPDDEEKPEGEIRTFEEMEAAKVAAELAAKLADEQAAAAKLADEQAATEKAAAEPAEALTDEAFLEQYGITREAADAAGYDPTTVGQPQPLADGTFIDEVTEAETTSSPSADPEEAAVAEATPAPDEKINIFADDYEPEESTDPEWLQKQQKAEETAYNEANAAADAYVALKEEREALEADIAAGGGDTVTFGEGAAAVEFSASAAAEILKAQEAEALRASQDAYSELIEQKDVTAEAESLYSKQLAEEQAQADLDKAAADAVIAVVTTDIMQGKDVSADSLEQLEAAAKQAYDTLTTAAQADDQGQYEKEQVENLEKLVEDTTELYETATKAYEEVQEEVVKKADKETKETAALIDEFTGEDGFGTDAQGNITVGENIDTDEERDALAAAIDAQIADVDKLITGSTNEYGPGDWVDVNDDGIEDPGETVGATNAELLGEEAISDLEDQKEQLEKLQSKLVEATELIDATDALIDAGGDPHAKAMQSFWSNAPKYDPKAQFRFKVIIGGTTNTGMALQDALGGGQDVSPSGDPYNDIPDDTGGSVWYAKSVDKPTIQFAKFAEGFHRMGFDASDVQPLVEQPTFSPISMTLIDPTYPNATRKLLRWIRRSGYMDEQVKKTNFSLGNLSPVDAFMSSIGDVQIQQLDSDGKVLEIWWLQEAFPAEINFGKLDYSSADFVEIGITWAYKSVKVQMEVKGAEEKFTYFKGYNPPARPAAGKANTCALRYGSSGTSETLKDWRQGLSSGDKCFLKAD